MNTLEIDGKEYEVTGYASDGLPIIRGEAKSVQEGIDADGNPIVSVNINVPPIVVGAEPGEVK